MLIIILISSWVYTKLFQFILLIFLKFVPYPFLAIIFEESTNIVNPSNFRFFREINPGYFDENIRLFYFLMIILKFMLLSFLPGSHIS